MAADGEIVEFGRFRLHRRDRTLLADGVELEVGARAFDLLLALIDAGGSMVSKDELLSRVWPDAIVEENNLHVQIFALRRALGADRDVIRTVPRHGYRFTGALTAASRSASAAPVGRVPTVPPASNLPIQVGELIGREGDLQQVVELQTNYRLLTLTGPGGIGKTSLALSAAWRLVDRYPDGVRLADLAMLADPNLVLPAIAAAFDLPQVLSPLLPEHVAASVESRRLLLVLDNCEHLIEPVARIAEALLHGAPHLQILATSREPLRAEGECVYRVPALAVPGDEITDTEAQLRHSAVRLFVARARLGGARLQVDDDRARIISGICRRLDGIPLAIELAAARAVALGVRGVAAGLDDRFRLLTGGRRTALPRHQTLRATLDWSYGLLFEAERAALRRLGIFPGGFELKAAQAIMAPADGEALDVVDSLANLVAKSLVIRDGTNVPVRYRLLDTTRAYALEKLTESGELEITARRHAEYYRDLLCKAESEAATRAAGAGREEYAHRIGNLLAALNWAFSDTGDVRLGVTLASAATDFWLTVSLLSECCNWGVKALAHLGLAEGTREEMLLQCGLGLALIYVRGMTQEARSALTRALRLSEALGDFNCRFRALYGLWLFALRVVDFRECLALAGQYEQLAETIGDPAASAIADWMLGMSRYYLAEHASAAANLQRARASYPMAMRSRDLIRFGVHMEVSALSYQVVTFWSLGFADRAIRASRDAVQYAHDANHPVSLCIALNHSSILLVRIGDLERAEYCIDELIDHAGKHSLVPYYAAGLCGKGSLLATRGDLVAAEQWLRSGLERTREVAYYLFYAFFLGQLAEVLGRAGRIEEGLVEIDAALRYANEFESLWCMPELLRIKGNILAKQDRPDFAAVYDHLTQALDLAHQQGALSWELRAATSLARLLIDQGRSADATALLRPVYDRFTEGFATADLKTAKALLDDLSSFGRRSMT